MNILRKLFTRSVAVVRRPSVVRRPGLVGHLARLFEMGRTDRLAATWTTYGGSINQDIYHSLDAMRARSQDLENNNEYMKRWLLLLKQNVVGPRGIRLQMRVTEDDGRPDRLANRLIEDAWKRFSQAGNFDVTGRLSRRDVENLFITGAARDGEALIRIVPGFDNEFGIAVQVLDPARLDIQRNSATVPGREGNHVVMGVEEDGFGRPVRYYVLRSHPQAGVVDRQTAGWVEVPAAEMIHAFIPMRAEQSRGVPWAHAASLALKDLGGYREAAVIAARVGAAKLGWWRTGDADSGPYEGETATGEKFMSAEPGEMGQIGPEDELVTWDPSYPHDQFGAFNTAMLQGIAGALGVSHHTLSSDLSGVSFSSGRLGAQSDRDGWMGIQEWMTPRMHDVLFPIWLRIQLSTGRLNLPASKFDKFNAPRWHPRRWEHIQPREQATADGLMYGLRAKSLTEIIETRGQLDRDEVFEQIARDEEDLARLGLSVTLPTTVTTAEDTEQQT